jgi:type I restriction-modification system DNA methylase subunit
LGVIDEEYTSNRKTPIKQKLLENIQAYREWLLQLTICDPACGSGAFLNQALDFLIKEHGYIDVLQTTLLGGGFVFPNIENTVLENNIFGVDLNEESVEIAKLSLWLRTAQPRRKLNDLSSNIKCGNSLIDSKAVAGDKAFKWEDEFPTVFAKGGFDVIIGNPPYVDIKGLDPEMVRILFNKYETTENRINLYSIFIEKGFYLIKSKGILSFINPNSILVNSSYTKIRKLLLPHMSLIVKLPDGVFEDAIVETIIFEFRKDANIDKIDVIVYPKDERISFIDDRNKRAIDKSGWKKNTDVNYNIFVSVEQSKILSKIKQETKTLDEIADFSLGITPYDKYQGHSIETIKSRAFHSVNKIDDTYKPLISGANITRFSVNSECNEFIKYGDWLGAKREEKFFTQPRILVRQIVSGKPPRIYAGFTDENLYFTQIGFGLIPKKDTVSPIYLLGIINSKLINFYHKYSFLDLEKELFQKLLIANCKKFPIKVNRNSETAISIEVAVNHIMKLISIEHEITHRFFSFIKSTFRIETSKKLQNWHELNFGDFIKELNKALKSEGGKPLTKIQEMDWMEIFETKKAEAVQLKNEINKTDADIDELVYQLYGLTDEEIEIVKNS